MSLSSRFGRFIWQILNLSQFAGETSPFFFQRLIENYNN
jgi:hypothetical protein